MRDDLIDFLSDCRKVLVRFVFWSRARFLAVAAVVAFLAVVLAVARRSGPTTEPAATPPTYTRLQTVMPADTPTSTSTAPSSTATVAAARPSPTVVPSQPPASPRVATVAERFVAAWVRPGVAAAWRASMRPYETPRLAGLFAHASHAAVPASAVAGRAVIGEGGGNGQVAVTVPTDTFPAHLIVQRVHGVWLVDAVTMNRQE